MAKQSEVIFYLDSNLGKRIDFDRAYGSQCVDAVMDVIYKYHNFKTWGDAVDYANNKLPISATRYVKGDNRLYQIKPGDILVWQFGSNDKYGHVGIAKSFNGSTVISFEQNIDGNPDYLEVGGPLRLKERDLTYLIARIDLGFEIDLRPDGNWKGGWHKDNLGWWYSVDEDYYKGCWQLIDGQWYYFDEKGYALENVWKYDSTHQGWYYFKDNCSMAINEWIFDKKYDSWFWFNEDGKMQDQSVKEIGGATYVFSKGGYLVTNASINANGQLVK